MIESMEFALDLLLGVLQPNVARLLVGNPSAVQRFAFSLFGIATDHLDKVSSLRKPGKDTLKLHTQGYDDGHTVFHDTIRVDFTLCGLLK
jgi:hypothetical protein